ncbi:acetyl-CoA synthetase-like protein [Backusella circina FSU 941]|nr:acetyl-CoA synthetase-like protein [Backusella circina FSU 941]
MANFLTLGLNISKDKKCLGHRAIKNSETGERGPYKWETYQQVNDRILNLGSGLLNYLNQEMGMSNTNQIPIGIWAENCPEWTITDLSCAAYGLFSIALYDTLGANTVEYIINQAEISTVVCSVHHVADLLKLRHKIPFLKTIVSIDSLDKPNAGGLKRDFMCAWATEEGVNLIELQKLEEDGNKNRRDFMPCKPDDLYCIMYTSGTTGIPKGVMLTHENFVTSMVAGIVIYGCESSDTAISFLPLAHIYQRMSDMIMYMAGGCVGYYSGDINTLMDDIQELKPTILPSVPRLLNKIYEKLAASTIEAPGAAGELARRGVVEKLTKLETGRGCTHQYWDHLIFNKVKMALGGNVRKILTGSAPIDKEVLQFLRVVLCCDILEGYGATETCSAVTVHLPGEYKANHVGTSIPCIEYKLVDVPDMNYYSTDPLPRGEILVRGRNISKGYYKEPEKTREVFDDEGWYHTGDIGLVDKRGCLVIIDRKKNIFKLAQGEYVAPEKIENIYMKHPVIAQIYIHGDSIQSSLVGIVVPEQKALSNMVEHKLPELSAMNLSYPDICQNTKVIQMVLDEMNQLGKKSGLNKLEFPKKIYLESEPFTLANNLLTPTFKIKRNQAVTHYRQNIDDLYKSLNNGKSKL